MPVGQGSRFAGRSVRTLLDSHPGVSPVAIHRTDDEWVFYPEEGDRLGAGDVVVVRGTWPATEALLADAGEA